MMLETHWETREKPSKKDVLDVLRDALTVLRPKPTPLEMFATETESIANLIYESMTTGGRVYHAIDHVFDVLSSLSKVNAPVSESQYAIAVLAALFHDVIYLSIDKKLSATQQALLLDVAHIGATDSKDASTLNFEFPFPEPNMELVRVIFDYQTKHAPFHLPGLNEFLSALLAVKTLQIFLSRQHLLQIVACIEASIPFRPAKHLRTAMDVLFERCQIANTEFRLDVDAEELKSTVQGAAIFAHGDLSAFQEHDTRFFLDSTWKLLAEWQPALLVPPSRDVLSSISTLHQALCILQMRYRSMNVDDIFPHFQGTPTAEELVIRKERTRQNIGRVQVYSAARLVALQVVLERMNTNSSIRSKAKATCMTLSSFLTLVDGPIENHLRASNKNERVDTCMEFLVQGRYTSFDWDNSKSFLSAMILQDLGEDQVLQLANRIVEEPNSEIGEYVGNVSRLDTAIEQALSNGE